jgi:hypothetical protein
MKSETRAERLKELKGYDNAVTKKILADTLDSRATDDLTIAVKCAIHALAAVLIDKKPKAAGKLKKAGPKVSRSVRS